MRHRLRPALGRQPWWDRLLWSGSAALALAVAAALALGAAGAAAGKPLKITSASSTAPTPLTPLTLRTSGLNVKAAVSVRFSNKAGFAFSSTPIRVGTDGSVVVAVPVYVDPKTRATAPGMVSVVLRQGARVSAPLVLHIQDLPPLSTYGTQPGEISHAFLVFNALLLGRELSQLQAAQLLFGIDTSQAQSAVATLLKATLLARNDVDRVLLNNSTVITNGRFSDGTPLQFDVNSQDTMDRVLAVYLLQQFGNVPVPAGVADSRRSLSLRAAGPGALKTILPWLDGHKSVAGLIDDVQEAKTPFDYAYAMVKGAADYVGNFGVPAKIGFPAQLKAVRIAKALGAGFAILDIASAAEDIAFDYGRIYIDTHSGADPKALGIAEDEARVNADLVRLFDKSVSTLSFGFLKGVQAGAQGSINVMGYGLALTHAQILTKLAGLGETETSVAGRLKNPFPAPNQGFAEVDGTANIGNSQGVAAAQSAIELCCFGAAQLGILGAADPSGGYDMFVPLGVAGTNYSKLTLIAGDFITLKGLASETVDLSGLSTTQPVQLPTMTGTCTDTDVLTPDADDPDCD